MRVNWALIIAELKAAGCSRYRVSKLLGVADATAKNWARGGEPGHELGCALLKLHGEITAKARATEEMESPVMSKCG
jgi:predicted transcriptional regulator